MVDEVGERCALPVLLAHEQQRDARDSRTSAAAASAVPAGATRVDSRSPRGRLPIWSWFWAKTTKRSGAMSGEGRAVAAPAEL